LGVGRTLPKNALALGAHHYIDTNEEDAAEKLKGMGGAQAVVTTIGHAATVSALMAGLAPRGRLVVLGAGKDRLSVSARHLVGGERGVLGSITGSPYETERTLDFSVLAGVRPMIEVMPLEEANEAYRRMRSGDVRFRMVLSMTRGTAGR